jgi:hypothetical protein
MSLNFPANPSNGDTYTSGSITYIYQDPPGKWTASTQVNLDTRYVNSSGDTMTGALNVPAAATGTEVPQVQEVLTLASGGIVAADVTATNLVSQGDVQTTSLNSGPLAGFRNLLINGDFRIWERGTQFPTLQSGYSADRWYTFAGTNTRPTERVDLTLPGFSYGFTCSGVGTAPSITQAIELTKTGNAGPFVGTWTLSFWTNNTDVDTSLLFSKGGLSGTGNYASNTKDGGAIQVDAAAGGWVKLAQKYTMVAPNADNICLLVTIYGNTPGGTFTLTGIQLEPGLVATPFEHRPIGTELALCQRYYQTLAQMDVTSATNTGVDYSGQAFLPVIMRIAPTAVIGASANLVSANPVVAVNYFKVYGNPTAANNAAAVTNVTLDAEL